MIIDEYFIIRYASRKDTSTKFYTYVSSLKNIVQTPVSRDWYEKNQFIYLCMETKPKSLPHSEPVSLQEKKGLRINNSVFVGPLSHKSSGRFSFPKYLQLEICSSMFLRYAGRL